MERRKQARLRVTQPVTLLVLGTHEVVIEACVLDVSTSGVQVRSPTRLACDTHVKIEGNDAVMLGTVCHCEAQGGGAYKIGIQLSDPLSSLVELELLNRALIRPGKNDKVESARESHPKNLPSESNSIIPKPRN